MCSFKYFSLGTEVKKNDDRWNKYTILKKQLKNLSNQL